MHSTYSAKAADGHDCAAVLHGLMQARRMWLRQAAAPAMTNHRQTAQRACTAWHPQCMRRSIEGSHAAGTLPQHQGALSREAVDDGQRAKHALRWRVGEHL